MVGAPTGSASGRWMVLSPAVVLALALILSGPRLTAEAQRATRTATVVFLSDITPIPDRPYLEAFREGLRELGWVAGQNLHVEYRHASRSEQRPEIAAEIVKLAPDVIVAPAAAAFAFGPIPSHAGERISNWSPIRTIPIVFAGVSDPVAAGMVQSRQRPGGTMTGIALLSIELNPKRLELLKEALPAAARIGVLVPSNHPLRDRMVTDVEAAARGLKVKLQLVEISGADPVERIAEQIDQAFETMARERVQAVLGLQGPHYYRERKRIVELSLKHRLPGIFEIGEYAEAGCLMAYAPNVTDIFRYTAIYVDKILKGAKAADLPVDRPRKLEFVVNMRTAKALGLTIPPALLLRADRVIE